jgi:adenosylcobinamide kinase/adenosylcobinamide-phosphate guanylyltransferase
MAKELILVLGGARSGKSTYAEQLALELGGPEVLYVATAQALDHEMRERILKHRLARPQGWRTLEAPSLAVAWPKAAGYGAPGAHEPSSAAHLPTANAGETDLRAARVVLLDCMTLLATNAVLSVGDEPSTEEAEAAVQKETDALLAAYKGGAATWIVVSNEVGMGLVPPYPLGRVYRDALGRANQRLAKTADRVVLMVAGLPWELKPPAS